MSKTNEKSVMHKNIKLKIALKYQISFIATF
jgi:hypothetical protein